jgi:hypothetical protein
VQIRIIAEDDGITRQVVAETTRGRRLWAAWDYDYGPLERYVEAGRRWAAEHGHEVIGASADFRRVESLARPIVVADETRSWERN